jgi:hypothetical protein
MINLKEKLKSKKYAIGILMVVFAIGLAFSLISVDGAIAQTDPPDASVSEEVTKDGDSSQGIAEFLTKVVMLFISLMGKLLIIFINMVVAIAQYDEFVDSRAVSIGWVMIRDLTNIFFVVVMLVIALGTLFNVQTYEYKKLLPKLILAVILVNFSKMIVGMAIDFGQMIMLTFVDSFKGIAAGAVVNGMGVKAMLELSDEIKNVADINYWSIFGSSVLALAMLVVACVTVFTMVAVLLFRIVMLWILIIFAPIAFIASIMPNGPLTKVGAFGQYWGNLSKYIIVGPVLAFFLWLSFSIIMHLDTENQRHIISLHRNVDESVFDETVATGKDAEASQKKQEDLLYVQYLATKVSSTQNMFDYIVTVALLMGSIAVTQQMGVMGGSAGVNAMNKAKKWGTAALVGGALVAGAGYVWGSRKAKAGQLFGSTKEDGVDADGKPKFKRTGLAKYTHGLEFNPANIVRNFRAAGETKRKKEDVEGMAAAGERMQKMGTQGLWAAAGSEGGAEMIRRGFLWNKGAGSFYKTTPEQIQENQKKLEDVEKKEKNTLREIDGKNVDEAIMPTIEEEQQGVIEQLKEIDNDLRKLQTLEQDEAKLNGDINTKSAEVGALEASGKKDEADKMMEEVVNPMTEKRDKLREDIEKVKITQPEDNVRLRAEQAGLEKKRDDITADKIRMEGLQRSDPKAFAVAATSYFMNKAGAKGKEIKNIKDGKITAEQREAKDERIAKIDEVRKKIEDEARVRGGGLNDSEKEALSKLSKEKIGLRSSDANDKEQLENNKLLEGLNDEKDDLEAQATRNYTEGARELKRRDLDSVRKDKRKAEDNLGEAESYVPQDYYARKDAQGKIYEEFRNINTTNEDELIAMYKNARSRDDKFLASAVAIKSATVGHLNEILDAAGYEQSQTGLNEFTQKELVGKLGMNEQWAYAVQNDMSNEAESIKHWTFGQSVGFKGGQMYQRSMPEQQVRVRVEQGKQDFENLNRQGNRLAWMTEYRDPGSGNRMSVLNPVGIASIKQDFAAMTGLMNKQRFNSNYAQNLLLPQNLKILRKIQRDIGPGQQKQYAEFMSALQNNYGGSTTKTNENLGDRVADEINKAMIIRQSKNT